MLANQYAKIFQKVKGDAEAINDLIWQAAPIHPNDHEILQAMEDRLEDLMVLADGSVIQIYDDCSTWDSVESFFLGAHWDTGEYVDEEEMQRIALAAYEKIRHLI